MHSESKVDAAADSSPIAGVSDNVELYDRLWLAEWRDMEVYNPTARHLQRQIHRCLRQLDSVGSLLDVGCGIGINIKEIRKRFGSLRMVGTDLSPKIMCMAREFLGDDPNVAFQVLDVGRQALPQRFDVVLCNQVLEHIEDDAAAMRNLAAMCERYLVITVPGGRYNSTSKLVGHHRHYTKDQLLRLVAPTGFEVVSVREWGFPFHSLYKATLGLLPAETQRRVGFGRYGVLKRLLSNSIYALYFANVWNAGANVFLVARRPTPAVSGSS